MAFYFAIIPSRIPRRLDQTIFTNPVNFYSFHRMFIHFVLFQATLREPPYITAGGSTDENDPG
jgi:hypothetical protein